MQMLKMLTDFEADVVRLFLFIFDFAVVWFSIFCASLSIVFKCFEMYINIQIFIFIWIALSVLFFVQMRGEKSKHTRRKDL